MRSPICHDLTRALVPREVLAGPIMVEEAETTTVVLPGSAVALRDDGFLGITPEGVSPPAATATPACPETQRSQR